MNQNINVNLIPKFAVHGNLYYSQYDVGREAIINLVNGSTEYEIPSGATVTLVATKPSGLGFTQNCTFEGNQITVVCTAEMTDEAGHFPCEIRIANGSLLLGTANFTFNVERSPHPEGTTDGTAESVVNEITLALESALNDIEDKGDEVIASIPSDYTELSDEVDDLKNSFDSIVDTEDANLFYFTDDSARTIGSSLAISFENNSTILMNGSVGSSNVYQPTMGNTTYTNGTFRPNLDAGTYTYVQFIELGTGDTSGTAVYYRTNGGSLALWSSGSTKTFNEPVEVVYSFSKNKTFVNRICQIMLVEGSDVPTEYVPNGITAYDSVARSEIESILSEQYVVPKSATWTNFFTESTYTTHELQGVCTDGTYLYYGMHPVDDTNNSVLGKIDLSTGQLVSEVSNYSYGHCNGMCYCPDNNTLLVADSTDRTGKIYVVDADTLDYISTFTMENVLKTAWENYAYGTFAGVGGIGYSDELEKFVFLIRKSDSDVFWGFAITDKNYKLEKLLKCQNITDTVETRGGLDCDDKYIYMCEQDIVDSVRTAKVVIYNYYGAVVSVLSKSGLGYTIEGISKVSDSEFYVSHSNNVIRKVGVTETESIAVARVFKNYNFN